jgi:lipoic acid synthetase
MMLGAGESQDEIARCIDDLQEVGCSILTLGQYLSPSAAHVPIARFVPPEEFQRWRRYALTRHFTFVESGPLVRSSYHADRQISARRNGTASLRPDPTGEQSSCGPEIGLHPIEPPSSQEKRQSP